jgi:chemotaxis protein CheX
MNSLILPIIDITRVVWKTTLGLEVVNPKEVPSKPQGPNYRATVELRGAWNGDLSLSCAGDLARRAAGVLFDKAPDQVVDSEALDALGELANMTGGNLKALLPAPCALSTPKTSRAPDEIATPGALRVEFACGPQYFTVELTQEGRS